MKKLSLFLALCICFQLNLFAGGKRDLSAEPVQQELSEEMTEEPEEFQFPPRPEHMCQYKEPKGEPVVFDESWSYVTMGRKSEYYPEIPVSDVCFFSAEINFYGELEGIPKRSDLDIGNARAHLVITCESRAATHITLNPDFGLRKSIINNIMEASQDFDGIQIDFEQIPLKDNKNYYSFLAEVGKKAKAKKKMFTVCVPGRIEKLNEVMDYAKVAALCDKVFVMAYDEHWSTSEPGAVASLEWAQNVVDFAKLNIPEEKIIMGVPFYGRSWADKSPAGSWYFSRANRIMSENMVEDIHYENEIPVFEYDVPVHVTTYFNDANSVLELCRLYKEAGITNIGFWRIGQEDPYFWNWIKLSNLQ